MTHGEPQTDDARVRAALMTLRDDVEQRPMASPDAVRRQAEERHGGARWTGRPHLRRTVGALAALAAAAVLVVLGMRALGPGDGPGPTPAGPSSTSSVDRTDAPAGLTIPTRGAWATALHGDVDVHRSSPGAVDCFAPTTGLDWEGSTVRRSQMELAGAQLGRAGSSSEATRAWRSLVRDLEACDLPTHEIAHVERPGWQAWESTFTGGGSSWVVLVTEGSDVLYLWVGEGSGTTEDDIARLVEQTRP